MIETLVGIVGAFYLYGCGRFALDIYEAIDASVKLRRLKMDLRRLQVIEECLKIVEATTEQKKKRSIWDKLRGR